LSVHSNTLHFDEALFPYCAKSFFYGFWPLVYLQLAKIGSMHAALFGAERGHINTTTVTKYLIIQD